MNIEDLRVDQDARLNGVWKDLEIPGVRVKLRSANSPEYLNTRSRLYRKSRESAEEIDDYEKFVLNVQCITEGALIDWDGIEDDNGPIAFSIDDANRIFAVGAYAGVAEALAMAFGQEQDFVVANQDADEKNSSTASSGRSLGAVA